MFTEITNCVNAKKAYAAQLKLLHPKGGVYNARYEKKAERLLKEWKTAERKMMKAIYK